MANVEAALEELIRLWEQLTTRETDAIAADAWDRLAEVQHRKADIQAHWARMPPLATPRSRGAVVRLIDMERRNAEQLARRLDDLRLQLDQLDQTGRNLRRLHRSYAATAPSAGAFNGTA